MILKSVRRLSEWVARPLATIAPVGLTKKQSTPQAAAAKGIKRKRIVQRGIKPELSLLAAEQAAWVIEWAQAHGHAGKKLPTAEAQALQVAACHVRKSPRAAWDGTHGVGWHLAQLAPRKRLRVNGEPTWLYEIPGEVVAFPGGGPTKEIHARASNLAAGGRPALRSGIGDPV